MRATLMQTIVPVTPNLQPGLGSITNSAVTALDGISAVDVWTSPTGVEFEIISESGGSNPVLVAPGVGGPFATGSGASVATLSDGNFVITWLDANSNPYGNILGQIYNPTGSPVGSQMLLFAGSDPDPGDSLTYRYASVSASGSGQFAVSTIRNFTWDSANLSVETRVFNEAGLLLRTVNHPQFFFGVGLPQGAFLGNGLLVETWSSSSPADVFVAIDGAAAVQVTNAPPYSVDPTVAALGPNRFVLAWNESGWLKYKLFNVNPITHAL